MVKYKRDIVRENKNGNVNPTLRNDKNQGLLLAGMFPADKLPFGRGCA